MPIINKKSKLIGRSKVSRSIALSEIQERDESAQRMKTPTKTIKNIQQEYKVTPIRKRGNFSSVESQQIQPEEATPVLGGAILQSKSNLTHKKPTTSEETSSRSTTKKVSFVQYIQEEENKEV